ncbi:SH3 domain-containing protein [Cetobacterium somerae]|uniref:SH3 domain-containing protein n=1 Tax=Cetobacterium somerae TaxID=188913 RepID=UPI00248E616C|nr:SH3 domain-containing protein [Cetobacterium somerae]
MTNKEKLEIELKEIFSLINSWLTFAEAKNAVILSVFCGLLYVLHSQIKEYNLILACIIYTILFLGIFSSLISFYPNLTKSKLKEINSFFLIIAGSKNKKATPNTIEPPIKLFYLDIADKYVENEQIKYNEYLEDLAKDYIEDSNFVPFNQLQKDYAKEIIINAKITVNKYNLFKASLRILITFIILIFGVNIFEKVTEKKYYLTISDSVIIREFPSSQARIKRIVKKNQFVERVDSEKEWIKIKYDSKEGWTHKNLLIEK